MKSSVETVVQTVQSIWQPFFISDLTLPHFYLAVSGGMDSMVLLDAWHHSIQSLSPSEQLKLTENTHVLHVHHGLQVDADEWYAFCHQQAQKYGVDFLGIKVQIPQSCIQQKGLEQAARQARQQAFRNQLRAGDQLLTAHHQKDQAETLLLNLFRGAGVAGLQGMPLQKGVPLENGEAMHWRPFLSLSHQTLSDYAQAHHLSWCEDSSNEDITLRRNFVRHQLLPQVKQQWPMAEAKLAETAQWMQEAQQLLIQLAEQDLSACGLHALPASHFVSATHWLAMTPLKTLSKERQKNALRTWMAKVTGLPPSAQQLQMIFQQIIHNSNSQASAKIQVGHWWVRGFQDKIYLVNSLNEFNSLESIFNALGKDKRFQIEATAFEYLSQLKWQTLQQAKQSKQWHTSGRFKKWFQSHQIPPWQRENWPGAWVENQFVLAGMPGLKGVRYRL